MTDHVVVFKWTINRNDKWKEFLAWCKVNSEHVESIDRFNDWNYTGVIFTAYRVKKESLVPYMVLRWSCIYKGDADQWIAEKIRVRNRDRLADLSKDHNITDKEIEELCLSQEKLNTLKGALRTRSWGKRTSKQKSP